MLTQESKKELGEFTTRKSGNSLILTVPKTAGIKEGQKFKLSLLADGTLEYHATKSNNPWLNGEYDKIDFQSELADVGNYANDRAVGKEKVEW